MDGVDTASAFLHAVERPPVGRGLGLDGLACRGLSATVRSHKRRPGGRRPLPAPSGPVREGGRAVACPANSSSGGERAGARVGAVAGRPRCARILRTTAPSVSSAMSLRFSPHQGQVRTSISNTLFRSSAHLARAGLVGGPLGRGAGFGAELGNDEPFPPFPRGSFRVGLPPAPVRFLRARPARDPPGRSLRGASSPAPGARPARVRERALRFDRLGLPRRGLGGALGLRHRPRRRSAGTAGSPRPLERVLAQVPFPPAARLARRVRPIPGPRAEPAAIESSARGAARRVRAVLSRGLPGP
jgi:hypothetical protein